ncbi:MAG TPA: hypothetical protein VK503_07460 [Candidatus Bathyarchaeia archaeon]|nr:hypothetical protein [Candidatus Bathyarchaeia archaeon]
MAVALVSADALGECCVGVWRRFCLRRGNALGIEIRSCLGTARKNYRLSQPIALMIWQDKRATSNGRRVAKP